MDWPKICAKMGWKPADLCGPVTMAFNADARDGMCCYGHKANSPAHKTPLVNGKPFYIGDYREEFEKEGLTKAVKQLEDDAKAGRKPPGPTKKIGGVLIYPARHFA